MGEILLGVILVLAFPVAAVAGLVIASGARNRLNLLEPRLQAMEQRLDQLAIRAPKHEPPPAAAPVRFEPAPPHVAPAPPPAPEIAAAPPIEPVAPIMPPTPEPAPVAPEPALAASSPIAPPPGPPPPTAPAAPAISFEERFGTQWVVWVGGIALALGGFSCCATRSSRAGSGPARA
jgi:uncharacterized membrane protein